MINKLFAFLGKTSAYFNSALTHLRHPFSIQIQGKNTATFNSWEKERKVILISFLAGLALAGIGGIVIFYAWTAKRKLEVWNAKKNAPSSSTGKTHQAGTTALKTNPFLKKWNDKEILNSLKNDYTLKEVCKNEGRDGDSLFLCVADQIKDSDIQSALNSKLDDPIKDQLNGWKLATSAKEKALILRKAAILLETQFLKFLENSEDYLDDLRPEDIKWITELYIDMLQEFTKDYSSIREKLAGATVKTMYDYFKEVIPSLVIPRYQAYLARTNQEGHWAGTSEMTALSYLLQRPIMAYGNHHSSSIYVKVDKNQKALPFLMIQEDLIPSRKPIVLFQCRGGGHYKVLEAKV